MCGYMCAAVHWYLQHIARSKKRAWVVWKQSREKEENRASALQGMSLTRVRQ